MEANRVLAVVALQDAITDAACGREVPCAADIVMRLEEAGWRITRVAMRGIDIEGHK